MVQILVRVSRTGKKLGHVERVRAHTGQGITHLAFVTLLFNSKNEVLLQKRKHKLFDGLWDFTAVSHPLVEGNKAETYQMASDRALSKEMGIGHVPIKKVGSFVYRAYDGGGAENEYCAVLSGKFDGNFRPNSREVYEAKWMDWSRFLNSIRKNSGNYTIWAKFGSQVLAKKLVF